MSGLTLRLRERPAQRLDASGLTPDRLAGLSGGEIEALPLHLGNRTSSVGALFEVHAGEPRDLHLEGETGRLDRIGARLLEGRITVHGDAGYDLAAGQRGGNIRVEGSAGDRAATGMLGGELIIEGDAGALLGCAQPAEASGMRGGLVHVRGNAGPRCGDRMRRGTVVVEGDCGTFAASRMIAGTLIVKGRIGAQPGTMMRRGTLLLAQPPERMPATFVDCGRHEITFLELLGRRLARKGIDLGVPADDCGRVVRFAGDIAVGGKAEILIRET